MADKNQSKLQKPTPPKRRPLWLTLLKWGAILSVVGILFAVATIAFVLWMYGRDPNLPTTLPRHVGGRELIGRPYHAHRKPPLQAPQPPCTTGPRQGMLWATTTQMVPLRLHSRQTGLGGNLGRRFCSKAAMASSAMFLLTGQPQITRSTGTFSAIDVDFSR